MLIPLLTLAAIGATTPRVVADTCSAHADRFGTPVPVDYVEGRFFARWQLDDGTFLRFFLDTGGPRDNLLSSTVHRLHLTREIRPMEEDSVSWVRIPATIARQLSPALRTNDWLDPAPGMTDGSVRVMATFPGGPLDAMLGNEASEVGRIDGILGPDWFAGRIWTLDYQGHRLFQGTTDAVNVLPAACWEPLGFQADSTGRRTTNFPRITARIDGEEVQLLFDAGATTTLTDSVWHAIGVPGPRTRGASFIVHERFERWRAKHPEWRIIVNADAEFHNRMILVPAVEVGSARLGPVWFSERPDNAFHQWMSQWMDRTIDGALGGSALAHAIVVLDYPGSRAAVLLPPAR